MESRCTTSYKQVFTYIELHLLELNPEIIHSDYEAGLLKALNIIYPHSRIVGCWFHYAQALRKKLGAKKGRHFFANLKANVDAHKIYKKLLDLPLLPADKISTGFAIIQKEISAKKLDKWFSHIYAYFRNYWIPKVNCPQKKLFIFLYIFLHYSRQN